ncbi:MAG: hypothetical protein J2P46_16565, partial [Zavarzinella sp.]|nr:hypothetical protein [Zavarzinella sp.]
LNRGLYFLLLDPDSPDVRAIAQRHGKNIQNEIKQVIEVIKNAGYRQRNNFHLRFFDAVPPFTAVMIDGDVGAATTPPMDKYGRIRVQPGSAYSVQHKGIIFTFAKTREGNLSGFDCFAQDLRKQWTAAEGSEAKVRALFDSR